MAWLHTRRPGYGSERETTETESHLIAAENNAIRTNDIKAKSECYAEKTDETINLIK